MTVVSFPLKTHHTHYCHATLTAHKTHCYNWLHCTLYPLWTGQPANAKLLCINWNRTKPLSTPVHHVSVTIKHDKLFPNMGKKGKQKGLFQLDKNEIRDEIEKRRGETKYGSLSVMGG